MRDFPGVGVACFVWKDNEFLMQKRQGSHGDGTWSLPGGHLEMGESWEECATREVREETGLTIKNLGFLAVTNDIFSENKHYITIWMKADWENGEAHITEPEKCSEQGWFTTSSWPSPLFDPPCQNLRGIRPELFE